MCKFRNICFSIPLLALLATLLLLPSNGAAQQVGSPDTVTADPAVPHPRTTPCVVKLFQNDKFVNFNVQSFPFTPPAACPGPWGKVILQGHFYVTAGVQFDRTANIWMGGTNIYFGTTPEPRSNLSPHWHF